MLVTVRVGEGIMNPRAESSTEIIEDAPVTRHVTNSGFATLLPHLEVVVVGIRPTTSPARLPMGRSRPFRVCLMDIPSDARDEISVRVAAVHDGKEVV